MAGSWTPSKPVKCVGDLGAPFNPPDFEDGRALHFGVSGGRSASGRVVFDVVADPGVLPSDPVWVPLESHVGTRREDQQ